MKIIKYVQAVVGLALLALGITLLMAAEGPDPWGTFVLALKQHLPFSLGVTSQLAGVFLITLNFFWGKRRPGIATIMSMVLVGIFIDVFQKVLATDAVPQILLLLFGIGVEALGIAVYVRADLGEGPVEGTMFVLTDKLKVSVGVAKVIQDFSFVIGAVVVGWMPQWGTLVSALGVGPATQFFLRIVQRGENKKAPAAPK